MFSSPVQHARRTGDLADLDVEIDSLLETWDDDGSKGCPTSEIRCNWMAFAYAIEACMHPNSSTTGRPSLFVKLLIAPPGFPPPGTELKSTPREPCGSTPGARIGG